MRVSRPMVGLIVICLVLLYVVPAGFMRPDGYLWLKIEGPEEFPCLSCPWVIELENHGPWPMFVRGAVWVFRPYIVIVQQPPATDFIIPPYGAYTYALRVLQIPPGGFEELRGIGVQLRAYVTLLYATHDVICVADVMCGTVPKI